MNFIKENVCGNEGPQKSLLLPIHLDIFEELSCEINLLVMIFILSLNSVLQD